MAVRNPRSIAAEAAFRARLAELGADLLSPWKGAHGKHRAICSAGHECYPQPHSVRKGHGICRVCAGCDPAAAEAAFLARLHELGATPLYEKYLGSDGKHRVLCAGGHECLARPHGVQDGEGICVTCAGKNSQVAEAAFLARLEAAGAEPLFERWEGTHRSYLVRCAAGHQCKPWPTAIQQGGGICRTCAGFDPAASEAAFRACLAELGAELLEPYSNAVSPHRVRCAEGHECRPRPSLLKYRGGGICITCAGRDTASAEAAFRSRLAELGATLLEPRWLGTHSPHRVRCSAGHFSRPLPSNVKQGHGICRTCAGREWDAFYVVTGVATVKFGISSGDASRRLAVHAGQGLTGVVRLVAGLSGTVALEAEDAVKAALALAGERPVRGREYFDISCLALVLDVADSWLGAASPELAA